MHHQTHPHLRVGTQPSLGHGSNRFSRGTWRGLPVLGMLMIFLAALCGCSDADEAAPTGDGAPTSDADAHPGTEVGAEVGADVGTWPERAAPDGHGPKDGATMGPTTTVTFTTYMDASCTTVPPQNSVVHLDTSQACNEAPKASISDVVCYPDKITYTNHPNVTGCASDGFFNTLPVGICQEFPGPVPTWKFIEPDTYNCLSAAVPDGATQ